ncbi:MAG: SPASM domain-containing protein, partial [Waterburya sp.]
VLTKDSLNFPEEIFNFFMEHQIRNVGFNIDETEGANQSSSLTKDGAEERYRTFMQRFYQLAKSTNGYLRVREFEQTKNFIYEKCNAHQGQFTPFTMINIAYNGDFSTFSPELLSMKSSTYGDFILGNVQQDSFDSICQTDKFQRMNQDIQAGVELCKRNCQYFSLCGGGAPSNKYFENGSFATSETMYCKYTKKIITDIVLDDIEKDLGLRPS